MRKMLIAAGIFGLAAAPALAADVMAGYYGNTVVVTGAALEVHVHYRADHTLDVSGKRSGQAFATKGAWKIDKGRICRTYDAPPPGVPNPFCSPLASHKVGDTWSMPAAGGGTNQARLVAGVH
ncbi:MAG TPA: hypothetical protein VGH15_13720 [Caulobacteraceae bacterium]